MAFLGRPKGEAVAVMDCAPSCGKSESADSGGRETTCDTLFGGRLVLRQDKTGYRFSIDSVLLAGLTRVKPADRVVDLGTGCGVVPLILAFRGRGREWIGVEIQRELAELARGNVRRNGFGGRVAVVEADMRCLGDLVIPGSVDLVVSNPPYRRRGSGRVNPDRQRALARHEFAGSAADVFESASGLLRDGGRLAVIYPASRLEELMGLGDRWGFRAKRLTMIHSDPGSPGCLVHLEYRKGGGPDLLVEPPFFIHDGRGGYSEAAKCLYEVP